MSLFGSMLGDVEDDPIFGSHMQSMQHMSSMMNSMNSMFSNPFGMMGQSQIMAPPDLRGQSQMQNQMMQFGFPMAPFNMNMNMNMNDMFAGFNNMGSGGSGMSSMSVMSYTSGPDGRPQVYQASRSTRAAPGGVRETQETVYDSRSGTKKMAIGHHIGDRAHVIEKQKNLHNGDEEEHQEYINLDEDEADEFNQEWQQRTRGHSSRAPADRALEYNQAHHRKRSDPKRLALTDGGATSSRPKLIPTSRRSTAKSSSSSTSGLGRSSSTSTTTVPEVTHGEKRAKSPEQSSSSSSPVSRKRERNDETETSSKRHMPASDDQE